MTSAAQSVNAHGKSFTPRHSPSIAGASSWSRRGNLRIRITTKGNPFPSTKPWRSSSASRNRSTRAHGFASAWWQAPSVANPWSHQYRGPTRKHRESPRPAMAEGSPNRDGGRDFGSRCFGSSDLIPLDHEFYPLSRWFGAVLRAPAHELGHQQDRAVRAHGKPCVDTGLVWRLRDDGQSLASAKTRGMIIRFRL